MQDDLHEEVVIKEEWEDVNTEDSANYRVIKKTTVEYTTVRKENVEVEDPLQVTVYSGDL